MSDAQESIAKELQVAYIVLRKLNDVFIKSKGGTPSSARGPPIDVTAFSQDFILKFLEERLNEIDREALRLSGKFIDRLVGNLRIGRNRAITSTLKIYDEDSIEFDEFFHLCLVHLYDNIRELDWHNARDICDFRQEEISSVKSSLLHVQRFMAFQASLHSELAEMKRASKQSSNSPTKSYASSPVSKQFKSNLSNLGTTSSLSSKKHVRFDSSATRSGSLVEKRSQNEDDGSRFVFALTAFIYGLNLFLERFVETLTASSLYGCSNLIDRLGKSKQKLKVGQLQTIQSQLKDGFELISSGLRFMVKVRSTYVIERLLNIICIRSPSRIARHRMQPLISAFDSTKVAALEARLISNLTVWWLQVVSDLTISDIDLVPAELNMETSSTEYEKIDNTRNNLTGFIALWLRFTDSNRKHKTLMQTQRSTSLGSTVKAQVSQIGLSQSSSGILVLTDSISELARQLFNDAVSQMRSHDQAKFFLTTSSAAVQQVFDIIANQLISQLTQARKETALSSNVKDRSFHDHLRLDVAHVIAKVRCLKCQNIFVTLDDCLTSIAEQSSVALDHESAMETKLAQFTSKITANK